MSAQLHGWSPPGDGYAINALVGERRQSQRHITVFQVAKLVTARGEELCIVRDISSGGLKAETYCPLEIGERVEIAFKSGQQVRGDLVWVGDRQAGIAFERPMEVELLLVRRDRDDEGNPIRAPRLNVDMAGMLRVHGEQAAVRILDVSQEGCRIHSDLILKPGTGCEISLPGLGFRLASIRWFRDGDAGVRFDERMRYPDFAHWRQRLIAGGG